MRCSVEGHEIRVHDIASGYRLAQLAEAEPEAEPFRSHRAFRAEFGEQATTG